MISQKISKRKHFRKFPEPESPVEYAEDLSELRLVPTGAEAGEDGGEPDHVEQRVPLVLNKGP